MLAPIGALSYAQPSQGMDAAISGAAALALQNYNAEIQANNQSRQDFSDLVGSLVGKVVTAPDIPGVGNPAEKVSQAIAGKIFDILTTNPDEPAIEMATELHGQYQTRVDGIRQKINQPDLLEEFITGYNELSDLQQKLRVDIGAQVAQPGGNCSDLEGRARLEGGGIAGAYPRLLVARLVNNHVTAFCLFAVQGPATSIADAKAAVPIGLSIMAGDGCK
jgi:hypothetical protein